MDYTNEQLTALSNAAEYLGEEAGDAGATWIDVDEGNTAQRYLDAIANCELSDLLRIPNLSGEFADDPTPQSLAAAVEAETGIEVSSDHLDDCCAEWEKAATETYEAEIEKKATEHIEYLIDEVRDALSLLEEKLDILSTAFDGTARDKEISEVYPAFEILKQEALVL